LIAIEPGACKPAHPFEGWSRRHFLQCAAGACLAIGRNASASEDARYPNRAIRCILPSTIGGTSDLLGRLIAERFAQAVGQPVVLDARPGAAGRIAAEYVANAAADGYTLLLANNGVNAIVPGGLATTASQMSSMFAPVTMLARLPVVVAVSPTLQVRTLNELLELARGAPGKLSFASSGAGSTSHIAAVLLFRRAGVHLIHVPYAGTSAAVKDVLSGEVPVLFTHLGTVAAFVKSGQLRALAVTGSHRMTDFPQIGTVAEAGYADFDVTTWHGIVVPAGTPKGVVLRLNDALVRIVADPDVRNEMTELGMEPVGDRPEHFAAQIDSDVRRWSDVIRANAITAE
jgi:tripartite-type tricarboxylate transporter receptor subunit TctC